MKIKPLENGLRTTNTPTQLCLDCHKTATHRLADCTVCHTVTQYYNSTTANPAPHYNGQNCITCHSHGKGFSPYTTVLNDLLQKVYAFFGVNNAYADPAPLDNYSMGGNSLIGGASLAPMTFDATATSSETLESIQPEIVGDLVYYYHNDHLGTPLFMSDEDGNLVWWRQQTPFGETTYIREIVTENLRLPGQYWDGEKNSSYNFYRDTYYSNWGIYGQPDPIGQAGGANQYLYANGNPVTLSDIIGLAPMFGNNYTITPPANHEKGNRKCAPCKQSWAECYVNCINKLDLLGNSPSRLATYYLTSPVMKWLYRMMQDRETARLCMQNLVMNRQAMVTLAGYEAGISYGCMISCGLDKCNY